MTVEPARMVRDTRLLIKGAGEMATGVAVRLYRAGFRSILLLETDRPLAVRRAVSFSEAVYDGRQEVEGIVAQRLESREALPGIWEKGDLAVAVDPDWRALDWFQPQATIDAVLAKRNLGTRLDEAPLVIALGPGFTAGVDAHCVVETNRGHDLGRVFLSGAAEPNTGVPGNIGGFTGERVLRAPSAGEVQQVAAIGAMVRAGDTVCTVAGQAVPAAIDGVVRGCIRTGVTVDKGVKLGDIDPRGRPEHCFTVSEKARALGGAVLEAICAGVLSVGG